MHYKCFPNLVQSFVSLLQILFLVCKFQEPISQTLGITSLIALVDLWLWPINCKIYLTVYRKKSPTWFTRRETPLRLRHVTLILTVIYLRSNMLESNQVAVQILTDHTAPVRWCNIRTCASLAEFKGHKGQAAKHAGALEELQVEENGGKSRDRERAVREPQSRKLRVVSSFLPRPLTLCVPDVSPWVIQSPCHLHWLPSPLPLSTAHKWFE